MRINHNIPALRSLHQLDNTNKSLDKTLERLSSGLRINRASDDAAGLAITQKMDTQVRGLDQAKRNAMDGISMIQTAEGALNEVHAMLQRIRELSVQVSNGTYDEDDRRSVQNEVKQLQDEIQRISENIEFNERKLLNGDIDRRAFPDTSDVSIVSLTDTVNPGTFQLEITDDASKAAIIGNPATTNDITGVINLNGEEVEISDTDSEDIVFNKLRGLAETVGANLVAYEDGTTPPVATQFKLDGSTYLMFEMKEYGDDYSLDINASDTQLLQNLGLDTTATKIPGENVEANINDATDFSTTSTISTKGNIVTITDINGFEMKIEAEEGIVANNANNPVQATINVLDAGPLDLQIGANEGQSMEVRIQNLSPKALGMDKMNLSTASGAQKAITTVDSAIDMISSVRSKLGAYQNRLEHTVANLSVAAENMTESLSRIEDADMAFEMAEYTQKNVLSQAGVSMLAQANQRPQSILQLLQG
ncbi:MAG: flagellin [Eubacteriales bacterium]